MGSEGEGAYSLTNLSLALDPGLEGWKLTQEKKSAFNVDCYGKLSENL